MLCKVSVAASLVGRGKARTDLGRLSSPEKNYSQKQKREFHNGLGKPGLILKPAEAKPPRIWTSLSSTKWFMFFRKA